MMILLRLSSLLNAPVITLVPINPSIRTTRLSQEDFQELAFSVMRQVFAIHNEFGRLFDEKIYVRELARRMPEVELEVPVDVLHGTFTKRYFADALVGGRGLLEFKAANTLHATHASQAIHYLMLFDLAHGVLINTRGVRVEHRFVNCHQRLVGLQAPVVRDECFDARSPGACQFRDTLLELLADWGAGLEISLYEEALTHFFGGESKVLVNAPVFGAGSLLGAQRMKLCSPEAAFKLTALRSPGEAFVSHARRLIQQTSLRELHWANITHDQVSLMTIR